MSDYEHYRDDFTGDFDSFSRRKRIEPRMVHLFGKISKYAFQEEFASEAGKGESYWCEEFHKLLLPAAELVRAVLFRRYNDAEVAEQIELYQSVCREFIRGLTQKELLDLEMLLPIPEFEQILRERLPKGCVIHLKLPCEYGGEIDAENLVLMPAFPYHQRIHQYLYRQMMTKNGIEKPNCLYVPEPYGKLYFPGMIEEEGEDGGGDGGDGGWGNDDWGNDDWGHGGDGGDDGRRGGGGGGRGRIAEWDRLQFARQLRERGERWKVTI